MLSIHKNFLYDLITCNLFLERKNMNHGMHVRPENVSTSVNLLPKYLVGKIKATTIVFSA
jgi:hypothetical protein